MNESAKPEELPRMTFGEHLEELRSRLIKSVIMLCLTFVVCMAIYKPLVLLVTKPHQWAMELNNVPEEQRLFIMRSYTTPIFTIMKLAFIVGLFLASPWIAYQLWAFIASGLYRGERRYAMYFALPSFALFVAGCALGYLVFIPFALSGLESMRIVEIATTSYELAEYLDLVMILTIILGCVFELPLLMLFFTKVGLIQAETYAKWRKFAIVAVFVLAAMLTPPDIFSQLIMAGPMLVLYEIGVVLSKLAGRKREAAA